MSAGQQGFVCANSCPWKIIILTTTRAVLSPRKRAKPCKFRYVTTVGNFTQKILRWQRKFAFSMTALSFDTTSPANPDGYRRKKAYIARNHRPWATSLPLTVYIRISDSPCNLKQSCLKIRASMLKRCTRKTVFNAKWLFKIIQGHVFRCRWKAIGSLHTQT